MVALGMNYNESRIYTYIDNSRWHKKVRRFIYRERAGVMLFAIGVLIGFMVARELL